MFAGHETTKNQLGWMVAVLSERPGVWDAVAADAARASEVVEEVLRLPLHGHVRRPDGRRACRVPRRADRAGHVRCCCRCGAPITTSRVPATPSVSIRGADRDAPHVAFGHGPHHCLGAALARAELQEGLAALSARVTCPTIGAGAMWRPSAGITGPTQLPIRFETRVR